jgi:hypothetical protein
MHEAGQHSNPALLFQHLDAVLLRYSIGLRARYFLGLDIYRSEPIPASGGPA